MMNVSFDDISVDDMNYYLIDHAGFLDGDKRCVVFLDGFVYPLNMSRKGEC